MVECQGGETTAAEVIGVVAWVVVGVVEEEGEVAEE